MDKQGSRIAARLVIVGAAAAVLVGWGAANASADEVPVKQDVEVASMEAAPEMGTIAAVPQDPYAGKQVVVQPAPMVGAPVNLGTPAAPSGDPVVRPEEVGSPSMEDALKEVEAQSSTFVDPTGGQLDGQGNPYTDKLNQSLADTGVTDQADPSLLGGTTPGGQASSDGPKVTGISDFAPADPTIAACNGIATCASEAADRAHKERQKLPQWGPEQQEKILEKNEKEAKEKAERAKKLCAVDGCSGEGAPTAADFAQALEDYEIAQGSVALVDPTADNGPSLAPAGTNPCEGEKPGDSLCGRPMDGYIDPSIDSADQGTAVIDEAQTVNPLGPECVDESGQSSSCATTPESQPTTENPGCQGGTEGVAASEMSSAPCGGGFEGGPAISDAI